MVLALASPATAQICLPPTFDGGLRLHPAGAQSVQWLEVLLRQHEVCWRRAARPDEKRVFLVGNSATFGFPHGADETVARFLDAESSGAPPFHAYNLGFGFTFQMKEALILDAAARYRPDLVVYGASFDDLDTNVPFPYRPAQRFLRVNSRRVLQLAEEGPPGLAHYFGFYAGRKYRPNPLRSELRAAGRFAREAARAHAERVVSRLGGAPLPRSEEPLGNRKNYLCGAVIERQREAYAGWQANSMPAFLDWYRRRTGAAVLVVNWPVAFEPRGRCYNDRFTKSTYAAYNTWLRTETERYDLPYLDLQGTLPANEFVDSVHPTVDGLRAVARAIAPRVEGLLASPNSAAGHADGARR